MERVPGVGGYFTRAAVLAVCAVLSGCSAAAPAAGARSTTTVSPRLPSSPARAADAFTVAGDHPVPPNGSQDTSAATPGTPCNRSTLAADKTLGARISAGFTLTGFSVSAQLLQHFLSGKGTKVSYKAGSPISEQAQASSAFTTVNTEVQTAILAQLPAGRACTFPPRSCPW